MARQKPQWEVIAHPARQVYAIDLGDHRVRINLLARGKRTTLTGVFIHAGALDVGESRGTFSEYVFTPLKAAGLRWSGLQRGRSPT